MRPNNRQRSRGGRNGGGGGGGGHHHKQHHNHNPNRPPNRNQIFDSSGPDVRVRGNAHQVFDKYQALAREAAASGDRIMAEAYWQYADHYFRVIQTMGGFVQRNNQGWGEGGEEGPQGNPQQQGQPPRKPARRSPPPPRLSQGALSGKEPLSTFGELAALFAARDKPQAPPPPPAPPEPPAQEKASETPPETPPDETPPA